MAVEFRDYYQIMGVDRNATHDEIRKAFRKLARECHPDVAGDKEGAEEKFKELNEAYEVLGDPEKRKKYDQLGSGWDKGPGFGHADAGSGYEYHFDGTGFSDFFEHLFGWRATGRGFEEFAEHRSDPGSTVPIRGRDIESEILVTLREVVQGADRVLTLSRSKEGGSRTGDTVRVRIPKGVLEGQLIRCAGLGEPGYNGGEHGDLFLRVVLQRHPDLSVEGSDLHCDLPIQAWDAVLGGTSTVSTPTGKIRIKIPPGSEAGDHLRVRNKGLPIDGGSAMGDLHARIVIRTPSAITDAEREHWERLRDLSGTRRDDE